MKLTQRRIKTLTLVTIFSFIVVMYLWLATCSNTAYSQSAKPSKVDTTTPTPPKTYTLTYDRNFLSVHLDSLLGYGSRFIGSQLSKDDYIQVLQNYNRIIVRIAQSGRLDSLAVKK